MKREAWDVGREKSRTSQTSSHAPRSTPHAPMTLATFIAKNALRNKRRAALSILSVAVSLFLLVTLLVALRELTVPPEDIGAALRIVVRNKISIATPLPGRQRAIIEKIKGVEAVSPFSFLAANTAPRRA